MDMAGFLPTLLIVGETAGLIGLTFGLENMPDKNNYYVSKPKAGSTGCSVEMLSDYD